MNFFTCFLSLLCKANWQTFWAPETSIMMQSYAFLTFPTTMILVEKCDLLSQNLLSNYKNTNRVTFTQDVVYVPLVRQLMQPPLFRDGLMSVKFGPTM